MIANHHFRCFYEEKDTIGKRYRRMDAIGTPFCVTVDHQTKEDNTVTIRYRDSMEQERVPMSRIKEIVLKAISFNEVLSFHCPGSWTGDYIRLRPREIRTSWINHSALIPGPSLACSYR